MKTCRARKSLCFWCLEDITAQPWKYWELTNEELRDHGLSCAFYSSLLRGSWSGEVEQDAKPEPTLSN